MEKYVVTGATSFIGVHLLQALLKKKAEVYAVIRRNSANRKRLPANCDKLHVIEADIDEYDKLSERILEEEIQAFYHLAWEGVRAPHRDNPTLQNKNYLGTVQALRTAVKLNAKTFVGIGSQAEYGRCSGEVEETMPCNPVTEYGKAKLKAYQEGESIAHQENIKFIWGRIFSAYGENDYPGTLIMTLLAKMKNNEDIALTECTQMWDFMYVKDIVEVLVKFANKKCQEGVYNIASGEYKQLRYFVEEMKRITGSESILQFGRIPYGSEGFIELKPIVKKLKRNIGNYVETTFEEGIRRLILSEVTNEKNKCVSADVQ